MLPRSETFICMRCQNLFRLTAFGIDSVGTTEHLKCKKQFVLLYLEDTCNCILRLATVCAMLKFFLSYQLYRCLNSCLSHNVGTVAIHMRGPQPHPLSPSFSLFSSASPASRSHRGRLPSHFFMFEASVNLLDPVPSFSGNSASATMLGIDAWRGERVFGHQHFATLWLV